MKSKTSLTISKELLGKVKAIAFDNDLTQSEVIESYVKYCLENNVEIEAEWSLFRFIKNSWKKFLNLIGVKI